MANPNKQPAFPVHPELDTSVFNSNPAFFSGMRLRDYFAAQAMFAIVVNGSLSDPDQIATEAYTQAAAMMDCKAGWDSLDD